MRVAVVGSRGQLGAAIVHEFAPDHEVIALDRASLDVTAFADVERALERIAPELVVNCAAYNAVDAAEDRPVDALQVNALAVRSLARASRAAGAKLVHYGSDFVFDGAATEPYSETDAPNPKSVYAASKLLGEWFAADAPCAYVLRVESLFGGAPGGPAPRGSVAAIVDALRAGRPVRVFSDRTVSPTYIPDAARATRELIERNAAPGLYHCVSSGCCTWLEFAREAARTLGVGPQLEAVKMADVPMRAVRPLYCALSNAKLAAAGIELRSWQAALADYLAAT
jgi:dTDP-4-dehydrorhamnose reductase